MISVACSSSESPSGGARVEHVVSIDPPPTSPPTAMAPPPPTASSPPAPLSVTPPAPDPPPPLKPSPYSEVLEAEHGLKLSPLEKTIVDDCPEREWSTKVPQIDCTKREQCPDGYCTAGRCGAKCTNDSQCGDGFCDRGACKALWTCAMGYGHHCHRDDQCGGFCIKGRCRSCVSDAECIKKLGRPEAYCDEYSNSGARRCDDQEDVLSIPEALGPIPILPGSSLPLPPQKP